MLEEIFALAQLGNQQGKWTCPRQRICQALCQKDVTSGERQYTHRYNNHCSSNQLTNCLKQLITARKMSYQVRGIIHVDTIISDTVVFIS